MARPLVQAERTPRPSHRETVGALIGALLAGPAAFLLAQEGRLGLGWAFATAMLLSTVAAGLGAAMGSVLARGHAPRRAAQAFEVELAEGLARRIARVVAPNEAAATAYATRLSPGAPVQVRPVPAALAPKHGAVRMGPWVVRD